MRTLVCVGGLLLASAAAHGTPIPTDNPRQAAADFIDAFNALDAARFDRFFAPDVTMFFPQPPFPAERIEGKAAVTETFHRFFDRVRSGGADHLDIEPLNLKVQRFGRVAVVSFELAGKDRTGRRSMVLRRDAQGWRIVHFHASSVDKSAK